jgi:hypothetical protein
MITQIGKGLWLQGGSPHEVESFFSLYGTDGWQRKPVDNNGVSRILFTSSLQQEVKTSICLHKNKPQVPFHDCSWVTSE